MKSGVIGDVEGAFQAVDSYSETVFKDEHELTRGIEITRVFSLPSGGMGFEGRAAEERLETQTSTTIEYGEIRVTEETVPTVHHAEFVGIPGEFVVAGSSKGTFAFDLIAKETNTRIERSTFDLDTFYAAHESATPWKAGFYTDSEDGVTGVLHGADLKSSYDLEGLLDDSKLNQLGLTYQYGGDDLKMTAAKSGYVEVYQPTTYDSEQYLEYLRNEVVPHLV